MNEITISLSVNEDTIPDPHQLLEDIVESLKLAKDTVLDQKPFMTKQKETSFPSGGSN